MILCIVAATVTPAISHSLPACPPATRPLPACPPYRERLTSLAFNPRGDWIAVGCAQLGQLLVWEWRSETYVVKQQGHYFDVASAAFSPDGACLVTGADDSKVLAAGGWGPGLLLAIVVWVLLSPLLLQRGW